MKFSSVTAESRWKWCWGERGETHPYLSPAVFPPQQVLPHHGCPRGNLLPTNPGQGGQIVFLWGWLKVIRVIVKLRICSFCVCFSLYVSSHVRLLFGCDDVSVGGGWYWHFSLWPLSYVACWHDPPSHLSPGLQEIIALYSATHCTEMLFIVVYCCNLSFLFSTAWLSQTKTQDVWCVEWILGLCFIMWEWHQSVFCLLSSSASFSFIQAHEIVCLLHIHLYNMLSLHSHYHINFKFSDIRLALQVNEGHLEICSHLPGYLSFLKEKKMLQWPTNKCHPFVFASYTWHILIP